MKVVGKASVLLTLLSACCLQFASWHDSVSVSCWPASTILAYARGPQPFQAIGPIDKQTEGPWPFYYTASPMRQPLHMHRAELVATKSNF